MTRNMDCNKPMKAKSVGAKSRKAKSECAKPMKAKSVCEKPKRKRSASACAKPKKARASCGNGGAKCSRPGPVTNNGYLNFLRSFRKRNCGLLPRELISKAARAWNCLPESKKDIYRRMACKITTNPRHLRRPVCQHTKNEC